MNHLATIQAEFLKIARNWDDMTIDEQWVYLRDHPGSKRKLTAKPRSKRQLAPKLRPARGAHPDHPEAKYDPELSDANMAGFTDQHGEQYYAKRSELPEGHPQRNVMNKKVELTPAQKKSELDITSRGYYPVSSKSPSEPEYVFESKNGPVYVKILADGEVVKADYLSPVRDLIKNESEKYRKRMLELGYTGIPQSAEEKVREKIESGEEDTDSYERLLKEERFNDENNMWDGKSKLIKGSIVDVERSNGTHEKVIIVGIQSRPGKEDLLSVENELGDTYMTDSSKIESVKSGNNGEPIAPEINEDDPRRQR
jgi:hypothetical protein